MSTPLTYLCRIPLIQFFAKVSIVDTEKELTENEKIPAAAISNHATVDQQSHMIGTRRLDKIPLEAAKLRLRAYGYRHARRHHSPICMKESLK